MSEESNPEPADNPNDNNNRKGSVVIALLLAFVPSLLFLSLKNVFTIGGGYGFTFKLAFLISAACCFVSAALLFRRNVAWAILVGILLLILNAAISLMLGCAALLTS